MFLALCTSSSFAYSYDLLSSDYRSEKGFHDLQSKLSRTMVNLQLPLKGEYSSGETRKPFFPPYSEIDLQPCSSPALIVEPFRHWQGGPYPEKPRIEELEKLVKPALLEAIRQGLKDADFENLFKNYMESEEFSKFSTSFQTIDDQQIRLNESEKRSLALMVWTEYQSHLLRMALNSSIRTLEMNFAVESFYAHKLPQLKDKFIDQSHPDPLPDLLVPKETSLQHCIRTLHKDSALTSTSTMRFTPTTSVAQALLERHPFDLPENQKELTERFNSSFHIKEKLLQKRNNYRKRLSQEKKDFEPGDTPFLSPSDLQ